MHVRLSTVREGEQIFEGGLSNSGRSYAGCLLTAIAVEGEAALALLRECFPREHSENCVLFKFCLREVPDSNFRS